MCVYVREDSYTPVNIIEAIYGLALCFFGGLYPLTIAAGETFRVSGGDRVKKCFLLLWDDLKAVHQVPDIRLCCRYMAYSCVLLFDMGLAVLCAFPAQLTRRCSRSPACEPAKSARARSWASALGPPLGIVVRCGDLRVGRFSLAHRPRGPGRVGA